jgi:hypothetical protein
MEEAKRTWVGKRRQKCWQRKGRVGEGVKTIGRGNVEFKIFFGSIKSWTCQA